MINSHKKGKNYIKCPSFQLKRSLDVKSKERFIIIGFSLSEHFARKDDYTGKRPLIQSLKQLPDRVHRHLKLWQSLIWIV